MEAHVDKRKAKSGKFFMSARRKKRKGTALIEYQKHRKYSRLQENSQDILPQASSTVHSATHFSHSEVGTVNDTHQCSVHETCDIENSCHGLSTGEVKMPKSYTLLRSAMQSESENGISYWSRRVADDVIMGDEMVDGVEDEMLDGVGTVAVNVTVLVAMEDQYENLSLHTQKGIEFLERYGHFIRDRCTIELDYAAKLKRLVKNYQPKKKDEEDYQYSSGQAFKHVMMEINDLAGQHEVIAENLQSNVIREVTILVKDFKEERKKLLQEGARMMTNLNNQMSSLDRALKNYEKAFKEAERALENFQRADADLNLSRAEVEKQRMNMAIKSQQCEETKNEYANQLQKTNDLQFQHYNTQMPDVFHQLQELDEKRIKNIKNFITQSVQIERNVFPIISKCLDGIIQAAEKINETEDTQLVIEKYKSGFQPPADIPFEDLSAIKSGEAPARVTPATITSMRPEAMTVKGTISAGKLKKRVGLFGFLTSNKNNFSAYGENKEDYSDLPPNQRRKKLTLRIEDITAKIQQETAARDGLMKMKAVYEQNPHLGDPMSIEGQLNECGHRLDKLRLELQKFQGFLEEAENTVPKTGVVLSSVSPSAPSRRSKSVVQAHHLNGGHLQRHHRNSGGSGGEEDSLSRSASDSSVSNPTVNHKRSAPGTPLPSHGPESGLGTSHTSLPDSDPEHSQAGDYVVDGDVLPPLGICRALYPFEATSEGSIPMMDGEELYIIELDQGDGWTRVRRQTDMEEGFVPTSYIECTLDNTC